MPIKTTQAKAATTPIVPALDNRAAKIMRMRELVGLRLRGRLEELMQNFSEDCEMYMGGGTQFSAISGRYHGRDEVRQKMEFMQKLFMQITLEVVDLLVEGDDVAIRWKCKSRNQPAEPTSWLEGMTVVKFRDNLVVYYGNYVDTAALQELFEL